MHGQTGRAVTLMAHKASLQVNPQVSSWVERPSAA